MRIHVMMDLNITLFQLASGVAIAIVSGYLGYLYALRRDKKAKRKDDDDTRRCLQDSCERVSSEKRKVPDRILRQLKIWDWEAYILRVIHASLSIIAIGCSLLVASKIDTFQSDFIEWLALTSALSTGLISGFDLNSKANKMRNAWRKLHTAIILYEEDPNTKVEHVIKTYAEAEEIYGEWKEKPDSE
jgi:hypothetical protein